MNPLSSRLPRLVFASLLPAAWLCLAGCSSGPKTYPVEGTVVFKDGTPFPGGLVEFEPVTADPKLRVNARGAVQPDGTFRLTTFKEGDGAVEGQHRAVVLPPAPPNLVEDRTKPPPPLILDRRFMSYDTSGLQFTVTQGLNRFTIEVEKPQP
jgi:hypothetical protein